MKKISKPELEGARRLTPMEMNNIHFKDAGKHSDVKNESSTVNGG